MANILFVYPDSVSDYFDELRDEVEGQLDADDIIIVERNVERAIKILSGRKAENLTLIVSYINMPLKSRSVIIDQAGLKIDNFLEVNDSDIPMILIVPNYSNEIEVKSKYKNCKLLVNDHSLCDQIIKFKNDRTPPEKQLDIVINMTSPDDNARWSYMIRGKNFEGLIPFEGELLKPTKTMLKSIIQMTVDIDNDQVSWEDRVELLSDTLYEVLFFNNHDFQMDVERAIGRVEKLEQTCVRFVVDESVYPVLLEVILSPPNRDAGIKGDYWLQHAPIIRQVRSHGMGHTLFEEKERNKINVLIIASNASGWLTLGNPPEEKEFGVLKKVDAECSELKDSLELLKSNGVNLGEIRVISSNDRAGLSTNLVREVLQERRWDVVHYAGHSYIDENSKHAYVFFEDDGEIDKVGIKTFAEYLLGTRLLVMSSCTSIDKRFIYELSKHQIPAVLGFRTEVKDQDANEFTKKFFFNLFELRSVDKAFYQTRKSLYEKNHSDRAWINPVLVLERAA